MYNVMDVPIVFIKKNNNVLKKGLVIILGCAHLVLGSA